MSLQTTTNINVDFYDKKYILVNAKQLDKNSRFLSVTCYNHGEPFALNDAHSAYIRYKKADEYSVFDTCKIDEGKVIVELTEQMLAVDGICYADLVIIEGGNAIVDTNTGAITGIENSVILSTMTFCIDVSETAVDNSEIESNYDFDGLNEALDEMKANYQNVVTTARSWTEGGTGIRDDEDINNAKYWAEKAHVFATGDISNSVVTGIKFESDVTYRVGLVDVTPANIGAVSIEDIAKVEDVISYLGIEI